MRFTAYDGNDVLCTKIYYSIGGGFVLDEEQTDDIHAASVDDLPFDLLPPRHYCNYAKKISLRLKI